MCSWIFDIAMTVFTGFLAIIGWCQYRKTTIIGEQTLFQQQVFQLQELVITMSKNCNALFLYGESRDDDEIRFMHCLNELVSSLSSLDHVINVLYPKSAIHKNDYKRLFWLNLNTRIREAISKRGYRTLTQMKNKEYEMGHENNYRFVSEYFKNQIG